MIIEKMLVVFGCFSLFCLVLFAFLCFTTLARHSNHFSPVSKTSAEDKAAQHTQLLWNPKAYSCEQKLQVIHLKLCSGSYCPWPNDGGCQSLKETWWCSLPSKQTPGLGLVMNIQFKNTVYHFFDIAYLWLSLWEIKKKNSVDKINYSTLNFHFIT